jgi:hypothetical protein
MFLVCALIGHRWGTAADSYEANPVMECKRCHYREIFDDDQLISDGRTFLGRTSVRAGDRK